MAFRCSCQFPFLDTLIRPKSISTMSRWDIKNYATWPLCFLRFSKYGSCSINMRAQDSFWMTSFRRLWHRSSYSSFIIKTTTFIYGRSSGGLSSSHERNHFHRILTSASFIILCSRTPRLHCLPSSTPKNWAFCNYTRFNCCITQTCISESIANNC